MKALMLAAACGLMPAAAWTQTVTACDRSEIERSASRFVDCARQATDKYRDQRVAILDGYRRIGRDFPAMGEHWIQITSVFDGQFDPARPEVLNYVTVAGRPQLLGVAYAVPLLPGESAPDWPAGRHAWHDHFRTIEDETVLPHHHAHGRAQDTPRLAMMHAWIWTSNPEGMFAADNWAVPYLRLGIAPPADAPAAVAKALSLAAGGAEYFEMSIEAAAGPTVAERPAVRAALARARATVESAVQRRGVAPFSDAELTALADVWRDMWNALDAALGSEARTHLRHLPIR